jgi:signal peptidase
VSTARQRPTLPGKRILQPVAASSITTRWSRRNLLALARAAAVLGGRIPAVPPRARRLLGLTANVTLVSAAVVVVGALAASLAPRLLGYSSVIVYGGSMADSVPIGSIAVTEKVRPEDVGVGDVIVFHPPTTSTNLSPNASPLMHRVVSVREEEGQRVFQTKGDANPTPDATEVALQDTGSRVVYTVPYVGYLVNFAGTPLGWALLLFLPATYLGLTTLRRIWAGGPPAR